MTKRQYDLAIIGGGPAGVAAGVYAARKRLNTIFITKDFNGQSVVSTEIQNWIGTPAISGIDLASSLKKHLKAYAKDSVDIHEGETAEHIERDGNEFIVRTGKDTYRTKTILIAAGSRRKRLTAKSADDFEHKGITYCASCDGPFFEGKDVFVVGAGNAAFESASQLLAYCKSVTLLVRSEHFRADPVTVETISKNPKFSVRKNTEIIEVQGSTFLEKITVKDTKSGETETLPAEGVFVEIGSEPNTTFVKDLIALTEYGQIIVDPRTQATSIDGIWAAGDCTDGLYHQNNIAAGDAVKALEDIYYHLHT